MLQLVVDSRCKPYESDKLKHSGQDNLLLTLDRRDTDVAQFVMFHSTISYYVRAVKLSEHIRRPHTMRLAFADCRVTHPHKIRLIQDC